MRLTNNDGGRCCSRRFMVLVHVIYMHYVHRNVCVCLGRMEYLAPVIVMKRKT